MTDHHSPRAEVARLREQFAALADQLDCEDEDVKFPKYDPDGYLALSDAADRIRRILDGDE